MSELNEEINIYSEEVRDVLSDPPKSIFRWGNTILLGFTIILMILSWIIKYPDTITARAVITTKIPPQKEYAKISGKIESLLVQNYQKVTADSPLAIIKNPANYDDVQLLKSILDTLKIQKKTFNFPIETIPLLFLGEIETAYANFENNYIAYLLNKESNSFKNNDINNDFSLSQLILRKENLYNQKKLNKEELLYKKKDLNRYIILYNKGVIAAQELENKKLEFLQAERDYKNINFSISQINENISGSKNEKQQRYVSNNRNKINLLKGVQQSYVQLKKSIEDWELKYTFTTNIDGTVSFMKVWSANQSIKAGDFLFTIVPDNYASYIAKIQAPVNSSGKIELGQDVNIKLEGYPENEYGIIKGIIKSISLMPNEEGYYLIDVSLSSNLLTTYNKEIVFKQEMQAVAEIITSDLRLMERIFHQFKDIFKR